ncbi:NAD(P)-binding protein [Polyplosphaeria fusca]|uniref:NAD(P)-binding protein n=1 Tax=Polyplosphaeria fusca TaxID=682080 RepID=A0A9P4RAV0_9PLEO|nr:NAD(P)-binding protein [Polyplosphaeria fusca]
MASPSLDPAHLFSVKGLVVVITGGGTGIGLMMAQALEANGATVYIIGRRSQVLEAAASTSKHSNIIPLQGDVTSKDDLSRIAQTIQQRTGYINVLMPNSGAIGPSMLANMPPNPSIHQFAQHLWTPDFDAFNSVYDVNATAVYYTIIAFLPLLAAGNNRGLKQTSQIITTGSVGAFVRTPVAGFGYEPSKAAVTHMMKQFATALVPYDIRANVLAPGFFVSEMSGELLGEVEKVGWEREVLPAMRVGDGEDLAGVVLFLVGRAGAYLNGCVLLNDGGRMCVLPGTY